MYFFDAMSSRDDSVHIGAFDVNIKDDAALLAEEMVMHTMFDIVSKL